MYNNINYITYFTEKKKEKKIKPDNNIADNPNLNIESFLTDIVSNHAFKNREEFLNSIAIDVNNLINDFSNESTKLMFVGSNVIFNYIKYLQKPDNTLVSSNANCQQLIDNVFLKNNKSDIDIKILFKNEFNIDEFNLFTIALHQYLLNKIDMYYSFLTVDTVIDHIKSDNRFKIKMNETYDKYAEINNKYNEKNNNNTKIDFLGTTYDYEYVIFKNYEECKTYIKSSTNGCTLHNMKNFKNIDNKEQLKKMFSINHMNVIYNDDEKSNAHVLNLSQDVNADNKKFIYSYKAQNQNINIILSYNDTLIFKKKDIYSDFSLMRYKLRFIVGIKIGNALYLLKAKSELLDISLPKYNDHIRHHENDLINNKNPFNLIIKTDAYDNVYKYSLFGLIMDLEQMIVHSDEHPWDANKYEKRLRRLLFIYFMLASSNEYYTNFNSVNVIVRQHVIILWSNILFISIQLYKIINKNFDFVKSTDNKDKDIFLIKNKNKDSFLNDDDQCEILNNLFIVQNHNSHFNYEIINENSSNENIFLRNYKKISYGSFEFCLLEKIIELTKNVKNKDVYNFLNFIDTIYDFIVCLQYVYSDTFSTELKMLKFEKSKF
jgi:hypothetical protein